MVLSPGRLAGLMLAFLVGGEALADAGMRKAAKKHAIQVNSNVAKAVILEDGLLLGHAGGSFDSAPGRHQLMVQAPGYIPRLVPVFVDKTVAKTVVTVKLMPVPDKNVEVELDFAAAGKYAVARGLGDVPSLCKLFKDSKARLPTNLILTCNRTSVIDDLTALGVPGVGGVLQGTAKSAILARMTDGASEPYYWAAEEYYAARPDDPNAVGILAMSAVRRRDCGRVMQIALETSASKLQFAPLNFARALCVELAGKPQNAYELYRLLINGGSATPTVHYHAARVTFRNDGKAARAALSACTRKWPHFYPCFEARAHLSSLLGQAKDAVRVLEGYRDATAEVVEGLITADMNGAAIESAYALRPWSFELTAAAAVLTSDFGRREALVKATEQTLISSTTAMEKLVPHVEKIRNRALMEVMYATLTRTYPKQPTYWIKLANAYKNNGRCEDSIKASKMALSLIEESSERRANLIVAMTDCLVRTDQYDEAEKHLRSIVVDYGGLWKAHYNLGIVLERLGKKEEAATQLELAITGDMPAQMRPKVEEMLKHLRKPAAGAAKAPPKEEGG